MEELLRPFAFVADDHGRRIKTVEERLATAERKLLSVDNSFGKFRSECHVSKTRKF